MTRPYTSSAIPTLDQELAELHGIGIDDGRQDSHGDRPPEPTDAPESITDPIPESSTNPRLTHTDEEGKAKMVDVSQVWTG